VPASLAWRTSATVPAPIACADEPIGACCQGEDVIPPAAHQQHVAVSAATMNMRRLEQ